MTRILVSAALAAALCGCATPSYQTAQRYPGQPVVTVQDQVRGLRQTGCQLWGAIGQASTWNNNGYSYACNVPAILGY